MRKAEKKREEKPNNSTAQGVKIPDYADGRDTVLNMTASFAAGFLLGGVISYPFYKLLWLSLLLGVVVGIIATFVARNWRRERRLLLLRMQFNDMLVSMSVSLRAGGTMLKALEDARKDLALVYQEDSDIISEIDIILGGFHNAIPLSQCFSEFAQRCQLEDVQSFASVYATIEGKSSRANDIIRDTQQLIASKTEVEMEIHTLMTSANLEAYLMLIVCPVILFILCLAGGEFMEALYTTTPGRVVASICLAGYFLCIFLVRKYNKIRA